MSQSGKIADEFTLSVDDIKDGNGDFPCPKCGVTLSPDDLTSNTFSSDNLPNGDVLIHCEKYGANVTLKPPRKCVKEKPEPCQ
jgi:hypothetical protein